MVMKQYLFTIIAGLCGIGLNAQTTFTKTFNRQNELNEYGYFKEFEIRRNNASVQIAWQTKKAEKNRGFVIERRSGISTSTTIALIPSLAPEGNK
jgi:hypothetical protein